MTDDSLTLKKLFLCILVLFLIDGAALGMLDQILRVPSAPQGIVSFEFCGFDNSCEITMKEWGPLGIKHALVSLGIDYLYLLLYPTGIALGLFMMAGQIPNKLKSLTVTLGYLAFGAGLCDAIENTFLVMVIFNEQAGQQAFLAGVFASIKFFILGLTLSWWIYLGVMYKLLKRPI